MNTESRPTTDEDSGQPRPETARRRPKRWLRIAIIALLAPVALVGLGMFLMRQSWVVVPLLEPILAKELGGEVEIGAAKVDGSSTIILRDVVLRSPAHEGEPGEIARVGTITIGANILGLVFGRTEPLKIAMADAHFRISEDADHPGEFAFMGLDPRDDDDDDEDSEAQPLTLDLTSGTIEVGTHRGGEFAATGRLPIAGTIESAGAEEEWFKFQLWETVAGGRQVPADPLRIKGRINIDTQATEGRMDGLVFDERLKGLCPQLVQAWWDALEPEGAVQDARLEMDGKGAIAASINVRDVALTIPIEREDVWRRYSLGTDNAPAGLPRMRVRSGRLELRDGVLALDNLSGVLLSSERTRNLAEVPYHVHGTFGSREMAFDWSRREEWVDQLLHFAPVDLTFKMEGFKFDGTPGSRNSAVELPAAITRVLEQFSVESCTLDTSITLTRAEAGAGPGGTRVEQQIVTSGRAKLSEGRGAYVKFAYPLEDVSAELRFDNQQVVVETLLARGPNGGRISIGGIIKPPSRWPNVDLHISGVGMPADEHLRMALPEKYRKVIDALRHVPSYDALAAAGALPEEAVLERARAESLRLIEMRQSLAAGDGIEAIEAVRADQVAAIDRRIASLDRMIARNGFSLAGTINMEIDVDRVEGQGQKTYTTGAIEIMDAGLIVDHFPYPFTVESGRLTLERGVVLVENWVGDSAAGGKVYIRGSVATPVVNGKTRVQPDLQIGVFDDVISPALSQAVALAGRDPQDEALGDGDAREELSRAAGLLEASGLEGMFSWEGGITTGDDGEVDWNFAVAIDHGSAAPTNEGAERMRELGLLWPNGFAVDRAAGAFSVSNEVLHIARIEGRRGEGRVGVQGTLAMGSGDTRIDLDLDFTDFSVEPYLLGFVPPGDRSTALEVWDRWDPQGIFDANLHYSTSSVAKGADGQKENGQVVVEIRPRELSMIIEGARMPLTGMTTEEEPAILHAHDDGMTFSGFRVALGDAESNHGVLELAGHFSGGRHATNSLRGNLVGGRFESPWLAEAYQLARADRWAAWVSQYVPRGQFDADFELSSALQEAEGFSVAVRPTQLSFVFNETPVNAAFDAGGSVNVAPGRINLDGLTGRFATGAIFSLAGEIETDELIDSRLLVGFEGDVFDAEAAAFIPTTLLRGLREIEFAAAAPVRFDGASVRLQQMIREPNDEPAWRRSFRGTVAIDDASFEAGVSFAQVRGSLDIVAEAEEGIPAQARVGIDLDRVVANERRVTEVTGALTLSDDGSSIQVSDVAGACYGGRATASATVGLGEDARYEARIDLASVNLRGFSRPGDEASHDAGTAAALTTRGANEGTLFASVSIEGYRGAPAERRGRGSVEVVDGTLASNPITLPIIQLSQLMLPLDASLTYGEASFYILGDLAVIEKFILESDRLILVGAGSVGIEDMEVDLRLRSRGRLLGISEVVSLVSDQLYGIAVRGPLADPDASIVPVPAISGLFRTEPPASAAPAMRGGGDLLWPERPDGASPGESGGDLE